MIPLCHFHSSFQKQQTSLKNIFFFCLFIWLYPVLDFPCSSVSKEYAFNAGDQGSIPGLGRSPGEGNGNPLQYSCLENSMDRGTWWATVHGVTTVGHDLVTKPPPPPPHPVLAGACEIFVAAFKHLVAACGIQFPDQGLNPGPLY